MENLIGTKGQLKDSNIWFILFGVLIAPALNAIDSIFFNGITLIGLPLKSRFISALTFQSIILLSLAWTTFWLIRKSRTEIFKPVIELSIKSFKALAVVVILLITCSIALRFLTADEYKHGVDLSYLASLDIDFGYLYGAKFFIAGLTLLKNLIFFVLLFWMILRKR